MDISENLTLQNLTTVTTAADVQSLDGVKSPFSFITLTDTLVVSISLSLIALLGITFNSVSLAVIRSGKHSNKSTRIHLMNQAASDVLMSLVCPARFILRELIVPMPQSAAFCKLLTLTSESLFVCSLMWNAAISVERFVAVYYPLKMLSYNKKHKIAVSVLVWTVSLLINVDSLFTYTTVYYIDRYLCVPARSVSSENNMTFYTVKEALPYVLLSLTIVIMYTCVGLKLLYRKYVKHHLKDCTEDYTDPSDKVGDIFAS